METIKELFLFIKSRKLYWMTPLLIILLTVGFLIVVSSGSAISPFIYMLF